MSKPKRQMDQFDLSLRGSRPLVGRTENQRAYLQHLKSGTSVTFGIGPAGTGKTFLAASYALDQLLASKDKTLVLTRATVPVSGEQLGFLPGTLEKKMEPWTAELMAIFNERVGREMVRSLMTSGRIQIIPFAFMRGRTFKDSLIIADEMQNATTAQAKMMITRIGEGTRYFINGDPAQSDLRGENGLDDLVSLVYRFGLPFPVTTFTSDDVERSAACKMWVKAYEMQNTCSDVTFLQRPLAG